MKYKSIGLNVVSNTTILTTPSDKKAILSSLHISNKDSLEATADVTITKGVDTFFLIKGVSIPPNSLVSILQDEIFLEFNNEVAIQPSIAADLDILLSYKEVIIF